MTVKILGPPYWKSLRSLAKQCDVSAHPREIAWPKLASSLAPRRDACRAPHGCDGGCSLTHFAALNTHPRPDTCACADECRKNPAHFPTDAYVFGLPVAQEFTAMATGTTVTKGV